MRYLLLLIFVLGGHVSSAQLHYSETRIEIDGESVLIRRSSKKQLDSFQHWSAIAHKLSIYTGRLQNHLDEAKNAIEEGREVYDLYLQSAQEQIDKLHSFYPKYDIKAYEAELAAYRRYKAKHETADP